jgi:hypothetical protein
LLPAKKTAWQESGGNFLHQSRLACLLSSGGSRSSSSSGSSSGGGSRIIYHCVAYTLRASTSFTYDTLLFSVTVYRSERRRFSELVYGSLLAANDFALKQA